MPGISRVTTDQAGGPISEAKVPSVRVNGDQIVVKGAAVTPHGSGQHASSPVMVGCSGSVRAGGIGVVRAGDAATCGHAASGSSNVNAG